MQAIGYTRVSTKEQSESGLSLSSQRAKVEAYMILHDLDLVEIIEDGGYSAKSLSRPGMGRLLKIIRGRKVGVVVVARLDRITRSVRDLGTLIDTFQRSGVEFASVADHIDTSTASGRLVLNVLGSVSQWESEQNGERVREAMAVLRAEGKRVSRFPPFGFKLGLAQRLLEDEKEQQAICMMQQLRSGGMSYREVGITLAARGYRSRRDTTLAASTVRAVLLRCDERGR